MKTILLGNVPEEYRGASSQSSSHGIVACRCTLLLATVRVLAAQQLGVATESKSKTGWDPMLKALA